MSEPPVGPARRGAAKTKSKPGTERPGGRDAERSKARLLEAAQQEFAEHGLSGARVGAIVDAAGVNKQLLYHYFDDKETLYEHVLQRAYAALREGEQTLHLDAIPPIDAIRKLIEFNFDFLVEHPHFVRLLNDENLHKARHLKNSQVLKARHSRLGDMLSGLFARGLADGSFKRSIDPVDFYISLASLCFFPQSNAHTMTAVFDRDINRPEEVARRRSLVVQILVVFLTTPDN